jgi:hypothetical protein
VLLWRFLLVMSIPTIGERAVQMFGKPVRLLPGNHLLSRFRSVKQMPNRTSPPALYCSAYCSMVISDSRSDMEMVACSHIP